MSARTEPVQRPIIPDLPDPGRNVFLMIRFAESTVLADLTSSIETTLSHYGLNLVRADRKDYRPTLWENVKLCLDGCDYAIAVFDGERSTSANVALELGYMIACGRPCLLLKDERVKLMQADLAGHLCEDFSVDAIAGTVRPKLTRWLRDLGLAKRPNERLVLFISTGGTCRDPMAKAIADVALARDAPDSGVRVGTAAIYPGSTEASPPARRAIVELLGQDLLADHRPTQLSAGLIEDADLILVMNASMLGQKGLPREKTRLVSEFFGSQGDVADPFRFIRDDNTDHKRYMACATRLKELIDPNVGRLLQHFGLDAARADPVTNRS